MTKMQAFLIRPAISSDVDVIADLSARTFVSAYQTMLPQETLLEFVTSAFSKKSIKEELAVPSNRFLLAYEGERPVGYALLREAGPPVGLTGSKPVELARIYLEEDVTGKGYGSRLIENCLDLSIQAGHDIFWLGVWERNARAIRFYEKKGFEKVGTLPFVFGDDLHSDLVMVRTLSKD